MIFNEYELERWKKQFPTIVWKCDSAFLGHVVGFADALGKRAELEAKIKQMAFPTFFGSPAHTYVSADGEASFYFEIHLDKHINGLATDNPRPTKPFAMNGGLIWHTGWARCPHEGEGIPSGQACSGCARENTSSDTTITNHRELPDHGKGSWSIHT
jgi:hypothetical protein